MSSRPRSSLVVALVQLALGSVSLAGCRRDAVPDPVADAPAPAPVDEPDLVGDPEGPPPRWVIDGTTLAADPRLPVDLDRALREHGRASEEVQDHILVDLNGDLVLDAVVLLPAPAVAGAYDHLVLLSDKQAIRVHALAELVPGASFSVAVVPLVDGPTLIAVAPRIGGCERGPEWSFLRVTNDLLEPVGAVRIDDYDCGEGEASIELEREPDGRVSAVVVQRSSGVVRHRWDASVGSFVVAD